MIHRLFRVMEMMATPPENRNVVWLDTTTHKLKIYENGEWTIYYPEGCILLSPIDLTDEEKSTIRKNIGVDVIDTKDLANNSVTTEKIADDAVTFSKLAEDAKSVVIPYGTSADIVERYLKTYRKTQRGRVGLYVSDSSCGTIPAINQIDNIIRAVSVIKSPGVEYVDIYILVFDGNKWSRQSYFEVGRIPADGSVTTPKIADKAVTGAKINDGAVGTTKLANRSVTTEKIKEKAVTTTELADGSVTTPKIADKSVTTDKIADNAVTKEKIKDQALPGTKLYNFTITNDQMAENSIRAANIVNGAVTGDKIWNDAITTPKIKDGAVTNDKLAEQTINTPKIKDGAVTFDKIADGAINTPKILDDAITADKIAQLIITQDTTTISEYWWNELAKIGLEKDNKYTFDRVPHVFFLDNQTGYCLPIQGADVIYGTNEAGLTLYFSGVTTDPEAQDPFSNNICGAEVAFIFNKSGISLTNFNWFNTTFYEFLNGSPGWLNGRALQDSSITADKIADSVSITESELNEILK